MKRTNRMLSIVLCLSLVFGLVACGGNPAATTTAGTVTTAPTQSTVPVTTAPSGPQALYDKAVELLNAREDVTMTISKKDELTAQSSTVTTHSSQTIYYQGLNTEDLRVSLTESVKYGDYSTDITEIFADGKAYANVYGSNFVSDMTAEAYTARLLPTVLVDANLYESCEMETASGAAVLHFTDAIELEGWLLSDACELISAQADVMLHADGSIKRVDYTASYLCENMPMTTVVTANYSNVTTDPITAPADADTYAAFEYLDGPRVIEQICGYLQSFDDLSFSCSQTTYVGAASLYIYNGMDIEICDWSKNPQFKINTNLYYRDYYNGETLEQTLEELYLDRQYSVSTDGGEPVYYSGVTTSAMNNYVSGVLLEWVLDCGYFENAVCTDLGSLLLIEFTGSSELGQIIQEEICQEVYGDPDLLDNYASSFHTEKMEYYVAVDKYLGLPTAIGMQFEGVHVIDGYEYVCQRQVDQSIYADSLDAYKAIHDVSAPDVEPEEKATPVFYHVTGPDGQEMWLLGTIHLGDDRTGYLPQEIYDAFDASDALALECDSRVLEEQVDADESLSEYVSNLYYYSDGSAAEDHIDDPELYELALKLMKATGNYFHNAPYLKVAMWSNSISNFYVRQGSGLSSDKGVDNRLQERADASGKKILEVESTLFQLEMLTGWSEDLSQWQLYDAVSTDGIAYNASLTELYEMWCGGDEAAIIEYLKDDTSDLTEEELLLWNEYNTAMSTDRNANMAQVAIGYLESGETVFFAVGLAHVLAEDGLVNALRAAGYTVELVKYAE